MAPYQTYSNPPYDNPSFTNIINHSANSNQQQRMNFVYNDTQRNNPNQYGQCPLNPKQLYLDVYLTSLSLRVFTPKSNFDDKK